MDVLINLYIHIFFATRVEMQSGENSKCEKGSSAATLRCEGAAGTQKKGIRRAFRDEKATSRG